MSSRLVIMTVSARVLRKISANSAAWLICCSLSSAHFMATLSTEISIQRKAWPNWALSSPTCFVVFGTYDPTTIRPPVLPLCTPKSLAETRGLDIIPILAETKLAAVRHRKRFPFSSAKIIPAANTAMSFSLAALTTHIDPFSRLHRCSQTAVGPPLRKSSIETEAMLLAATRPCVFSSTHSLRFDDL
uniref:Uncharacterized protein n=1 Tax=Opuntia streptacantha TaxID=393608 RepID=A0A7C9CV89_OPUST